MLPGHDDGTVALSGGSLLKGVDAYQCSYATVAGNDVRLFTVVLNVASTDELFAEIKPTGWVYEEDEAISLGDGGWSRGEKENWKITVMKGRTVIDLELIAPTGTGAIGAIAGTRRDHRGENPGFQAVRASCRSVARAVRVRRLVQNFPALTSAMNRIKPAKQVRWSSYSARWLPLGQWPRESSLQSRTPALRRGSRFWSARRRARHDMQPMAADRDFCRSSRGRRSNPGWFRSQFNAKIVIEGTVINICFDRDQPKRQTW